MPREPPKLRDKSSTLFHFESCYTYNSSVSEMSVISLMAGFCAAGVGGGTGILQSIIMFVGSFGLIAIGLLMQGTLFIGLGYTVVYMGAITIVFVFAVLVINSKNTTAPRSQLSPYKTIAGLILVFGGAAFFEGAKLGHAPLKSFSPRGEELLTLSSLSLGGAVEVIATVGFILLFVILGPVLVWVRG